jgi:hypothetical protein
MARAKKPKTDTAEATETFVPESINLSDLGALLQIVDLATQRGAFRGAELSQVGTVFDKLNAFLAYIQQQQSMQSDDNDQTDSAE